MENWYLACHKAGKHNAFKAQVFLAQPQINAIVFIPQICSYRPRTDRPGQLKKLMEPLFPGYMFICFDPEVTHTSKISGCPGVSHLVRFSDKIMPVHDHIVEEIMQLPICVHSPVIKERKNKTILTAVQHDELMNMVAEKDGLTRSTMFYTFAQSVIK
jgi:transcriptional antiterminator RfaH